MIPSFFLAHKIQIRLKYVMIICFRLFSSPRVKSSLVILASFTTNASDYLGNEHRTQFRIKTCHRASSDRFSVFSKPEIWGGTSFSYVCNCLHVIPGKVVAVWGQEKTQPKRINCYAYDCKTKRWKETGSLMTLLGYEINQCCDFPSSRFFAMQNNTYS